MSISMFAIGFVIFCIYMAFLIWNIYNGHESGGNERQFENEPDNLDMDGMGNFSRFPKTKNSRND